MIGGLWGKLRENVRDVVFGLEDSLVSTLGTVTGVAVATHDAYIVLLTGTVLVCVEAVSMSAGSYLSSKSATELYEERARQDHARVLSEHVSDRESLAELFTRKGFTKAEIAVAVAAIGRERRIWLKEVSRCEYRHAPSVSASPVVAAFFMGGFYIIGGGVTLAPYIFLDMQLAVPVTIMMTFVALFGVGVLKAQLTGANLWRSGLEMFAVSTTASVLGYALGIVIPLVFDAVH
jgi:vacuolar iron transporter family protein